MGFKTKQLTENQYQVTHEVGPHQQGIRLDAFLKQFYSRRSREELKRFIDRGDVSVVRNQGPHLTVGRLKPSSQLVPGDEVSVLRTRRPEPDVNFNYRLLYEDDALFVIDKPPHLPVHPAGRYFFNTLIVHLKTAGHKTRLRAERDIYLVHRIDKETSGVLVLAKSREVCAHLVSQFARRETEKRYLAIVHGIPENRFSVALPLRRARGSAIKLKMEVVPPSEPGGLSALTEFRLIAVAGSYSLLECFPKTGRQHQIRVHLESAGHPIVGDKLYGRPEEEALRFLERQSISPEAEAKLFLPRHALQAARLAFHHPVSGKRLEFHSELPADLKEFLERLSPPRGDPSTFRPFRL